MISTMFAPQKDSPTSFLTGAIDALTTTIHVVDASIFPQELPFPLTLGFDRAVTETVLVTAVAGEILTVQRGFYGAAAEWIAGTKCARVLTAADVEALQKNIAATCETLKNLTPASIGAQPAGNYVDADDFDDAMQRAQAAHEALETAVGDEELRAKTTESGLLPRTLASCLLTSFALEQQNGGAELTLGCVSTTNGNTETKSHTLDLSPFERSSNKVEISHTATETQYPSAKSVWDLVQDVAAQLPAGGLKVPISLALESQLPINLTAQAPGDYWYIQDMDLTAGSPESVAFWGGEPGHTGRAWVNNDGPGGTKQIHTVFDQWQSMDGRSIVQTGGGEWQVSTTWLDGLLAAKGYALSSAVYAKSEVYTKTEVDSRISSGIVMPTSGKLAGLTAAQAFQYLSDWLNGTQKTDVKIKVSEIDVI